ncbi:unnamed protein product [Lactuca virosa]|uniref:Uncharacterized protein n=1 Tax=Lactuca virosa TaxID=75947 RepID=A0AAU9LFY3_9ASTR|nr:unnamed protein product [Lactuca virosa]
MIPSSIGEHLAPSFQFQVMSTMLNVCEWLKNPSQKTINNEPINAPNRRDSWLFCYVFFSASSRTPPPPVLLSLPVCLSIESFTVSLLRLLLLFFQMIPLPTTPFTTCSSSGYSNSTLVTASGSFPTASLLLIRVQFCFLLVLNCHSS